jgi:EmrB/QacA subfamily drug resistance transporter
MHNARGDNYEMDNKAAISPARTGAGPQTWGQGAAEDKTYIKGTQLLIIMISVLLGILLAALDQTIVGPALPKIVGDLQGFDRYSWVVTVYLLTSTISVPIVGKLSDMYGRKWFYMAGIVIFLIGSALAGLSADMNQLIIFRGIQGLGAGILMACAFAIIADLIPPAERGKWQGVFGSVFGLSSVVGPTIGGLLTDNFSWHWIFYVNVPIGIVALAVLYFTFPTENRSHVKKSIDWLGAGALVVSLVPLLIALSLGGTPDWDWGSVKVIGMLVVAVVFLAAFLFIETRAAEPIIPLDLFKSRIFTVSVATVFLTGVGLFGAVLVIPLFIQAIQGGTATASGNSITPMTLGIVVSSVITGQLISRTGKYRIIGIVGMALVTIGMALLYTMSMDTDRLVTIFYMIIMGLGLGVAFPLYTLVVQNAFPIQRVGVVTAAVQFFRSIGSTVGVAILGTVVNNQFHSHFGPELQKQVAALPASVASQIPVDKLAAGLGSINPQALVSDAGKAALHTQLTNFVPAGPQQGQFVDSLMTLITNALKPSLFAGIQEAFLIGAILVGAGFVLTIFLKEIPLRKSNRGGTGGPSTGEGGWDGGDSGPQGPGGWSGNGKVNFEQAAEEAGKEMAASGMPATEIPADEEPELIPRK